MYHVEEVPSLPSSSSSSPLSEVVSLQAYAPAYLTHPIPLPSETTETTAEEKEEEAKRRKHWQLKGEAAVAAAQEEEAEQNEVHWSVGYPSAPGMPWPSPEETNAALLDPTISTRSMAMDEVLFGWDLRRNEEAVPPRREPEEEEDDNDDEGPQEVMYRCPLVVSVGAPTPEASTVSSGASPSFSPFTHEDEEDRSRRPAGAPSEGPSSSSRWVDITEYAAIAKGPPSPPTANGGAAAFSSSSMSKKTAGEEEKEESTGPMPDRLPRSNTSRVEVERAGQQLSVANEAVYEFLHRFHPPPSSFSYPFAVAHHTPGSTMAFSSGDTSGPVPSSLPPLSWSSPLDVGYGRNEDREGWRGRYGSPGCASGGGIRPLPSPQLPTSRSVHGESGGGGAFMRDVPFDGSERTTLQTPSSWMSTTTTAEDHHGLSRPQREGMGNTGVERSSCFFAATSVSNRETPSYAYSRSGHTFGWTAAWHRRFLHATTRAVRWLVAEEVAREEAERGGTRGRNRRTAREKVRGAIDEEDVEVEEEGWDTVAWRVCTLPLGPLATTVFHFFVGGDPALSPAQRRFRGGGQEEVDPEIPRSVEDEDGDDTGAPSLMSISFFPPALEGHAECHVTFSEVLDHLRNYRTYLHLQHRQQVAAARYVALRDAWKLQGVVKLQQEEDHRFAQLVKEEMQKAAKRRAYFDAQKKKIAAWKASRGINNNNSSSGGGNGPSSKPSPTTTTTTNVAAAPVGKRREVGDKEPSAPSSSSSSSLVSSPPARRSHREEAARRRGTIQEGAEGNTSSHPHLSHPPHLSHSHPPPPHHSGHVSRETDVSQRPLPSRSTHIKTTTTPHVSSMMATSSAPHPRSASLGVSLPRSSKATTTTTTTTPITNIPSPLEPLLRHRLYEKGAPPPPSSDAVALGKARYQRLQAFHRKKAAQEKSAVVERVWRAQQEALLWELVEEEAQDVRKGGEERRRAESQTKGIPKDGNEEDVKRRPKWEEEPPPPPQPSPQRINGGEEERRDGTFSNRASRGRRRPLPATPSPRRGPSLRAAARVVGASSAFFSALKKGSPLLSSNSFTFSSPLRGAPHFTDPTSSSLHRWTQTVYPEADRETLQLLSGRLSAKAR